ncbi:hypothetical protein EJ06DRAFT_526617 [Trichodelitschia bisporula]|uniref:Aflatoxin regulatory protein domain-containing protein n=1 Tax=Trichodelitschia bisporula TaxID=703511 RepID=A0A6G1I8U3_9PEZI|nr:hypothetical protein EJ06DRAFT_526617 [Trichodelitschia bisporula]
MCSPVFIVSSQQNTAEDSTTAPTESAPTSYPYWESPQQLWPQWPLHYFGTPYAPESAQGRICTIAPRMSGCTCFASALQVSEQLHRTEAALASTAFDHVLNVARHASAVCRQYAACPLCADPSYFPLYVIILRKAAACYSHLIQAASPAGASPGTASTASGVSASSSGQGAHTSRVRIGAFEVDAPLDDHTRALILRTEVRRAAEAACALETVLGPGSPKAAAHRDETALMYQRGLVGALREEIGALEGVLQSI